MDETFHRIGFDLYQTDEQLYRDPVDLYETDRMLYGMDGIDTGRNPPRPHPTVDLYAVDRWLFASPEDHRKVMNSIMENKLKDMSMHCRSSSSVLCTICLENICHGQEEVLLDRCNHSFHLKCILPWASHSWLCPLCRVEMRSLQELQTIRLSTERSRLEQVHVAVMDPSREASFSACDSSS